MKIQHDAVGRILGWSKRKKREMTVGNEYGTLGLKATQLKTIGDLMLTNTAFDFIYSLDLQMR